MLKRNISWLMGYEKEAYLNLLFHYTRKKDFQESTPKIQMLMIRLAQTSHFGLRDIIPPRVPASFSHILCKIWEHTYVQKCGGGEWCFKNIFIFPICIIQKVTILAPKSSCTFMEIGNQMQNHKIETNSELTYEDGSFWSTLIFIKIIGSDTLWFPLPPSEVLEVKQPALSSSVKWIQN